MADGKNGGGDDLKASFVFVPHGDPLPLEWMARHPGWVKFPATFVPHPVPRRVVPSRMWDEAGVDGAPGHGPMSRPVSVGAPVVQRRRVPVHRLPTGAGSFGEKDAVAAYRQASDVMDNAASMYLAAHRTGAETAGSVLASHAKTDVSTEKPESGGEGHQHKRPSQEHHRYALAPPEEITAIDNALKDPRVIAFLRLLSFEEHGRERENNYRRRFGDSNDKDPITDADMDNYIGKNMSTGRGTNTPGGAYQITQETYDRAKQEGIVSNFRPDSQSRIAVSIFYEEHALQVILDQNIDKAFYLLKRKWSSLPGGRGVRENLKAAKSRYDRYLNEEIAKSQQKE